MFITGIYITKYLRSSKHSKFKKVNYCEFAILLAFYIFQEYIIELWAIKTGYITFYENDWNWCYAKVKGECLTIVPIAVWTSASIIYYNIILLFTAYKGSIFLDATPILYNSVYMETEE